MDYKKYLENLNNMDNIDDFNDDFDSGLLSGIEQKAPKELHENVMKLVRQEKEQEKHFRYKKYMPVAAAILIGVLTFANSAINNNKVSQNLLNNSNNVGVENTVEPQKKPVNQIAKLNEDNNSNSQKPEVSADNNKSDKNEKSINNQSKTNIAVKGNSENNKEKNAGKNTKQNSAKTYVAVKDTEATNDNQQSAIKSNDQTKADASVAEMNNDAGNSKEEQEIKYGIAFENQRQQLIAKSYTQDMTVNYEVELSIDQFDIIDFINSRGSILSYRIYRLSREDASMLDALLSSQQIQKKVINETDESDSIIVKLIIGNK